MEFCHLLGLRSLPTTDTKFYPKLLSSSAVSQAAESGHRKTAVHTPSSSENWRLGKEFQTPNEEQPTEYINVVDSQQIGICQATSQDGFNTKAKFSKPTLGPPIGDFVSSSLSFSLGALPRVCAL